MVEGKKPMVLRSIVFWSGLLVLLFLGWAWRDSLKYETSVNWDAGRLVKLRHVDSQIRIYIAEGAESGFSHFRDEVDPGQKTAFRWPRPSFEKASIDDQAVYDATIPHWLLLASTLTVWGAVIALRARRLSKANG